MNKYGDVGADLCVCPVKEKSGAHAGAPLPHIVQWFKTMTTNEYIQLVKTDCWETFPGKLWQRNYYEHIVRNDDGLHNIRLYIQCNPQVWLWDREYVN